MTPLSDRLKNKKVAVAFSSGFFGFYHHAGVLKALLEAGVVPVHVCGTSAGAIVAALYGAGLDGPEICEALLKIERRDFFDLQFPFSKKGFGFLAGEKLGAALARLLPVHSFEACRVPVSVGVYRVKDGRSVQIRSGSLIMGVRASCAAPYMFQPVEIDGEIYWDGGFQERTPIGYLVYENVDTVFVSHVPPRDYRNGRTPKDGLFSNISIFAKTPLEERHERDRTAVRILREHGKEVQVLSPGRIWLGPFSLDKAKDAMAFAYKRAKEALASTDEMLPGSDELK
jgi:NTE family protein